MLGSCWILIPQTPAKLHTSHFVLCHSANSSLWHWCRVGTMTVSSACDGDSGKSDWCELAFSVLLNQFALESYRIVLRSCQRTFWMTPRPSHKFREFPSLSMASGYAQKVCWQIFHTRRKPNIKCFTAKQRLLWSGSWRFWFILILYTDLST